MLIAIISVKYTANCKEINKSNHAIKICKVRLLFTSRNGLEIDKRIVKIISIILSRSEYKKWFPIWFNVSIDTGYLKCGPRIDEIYNKAISNKIKSYFE